MKPHRLLAWCATAFVLLLLALLVRFNHDKPRLLIVHSFSEDGHWETLFDEGVRRALADNRQPLSVRWHYMSFSEAETQTAGDWAAASRRARAVIDTWQPDVVVLVGEEAQQWLGLRYAAEDARARRVVYATGEDPQRFGYPGAANVTGVREQLPLAQVREVLAQLETRRLRIQALGIADPTGEAEREQILAFDWQANDLLPVTLVKDYAEWQQAVREAQVKADVLLVLSFGGLPRSTSAPDVVPPAEVARWTEDNAAPLAISVRENFVRGGGSIAIAPSADGLGEQTARLALRALPGKSLPAPENSEDFAIGLRPARLAQRGYRLPGIYTQAARAAGLLFRGESPQGAPMLQTDATARP